MRKVKYKVYTNGKDKVVAVSTYAGKQVKGVAKCDPRDTFDFEKGTELAKARCNEKVADLRVARAYKCRSEAYVELYKAQNYLKKMNKYFEDSIEALHDASEKVEELKKNM